MIGEDETFSLDGPPEQMVRDLSRWMRGVDAAFATANPSELVWGHVAALTSVMSLMKKLPGFECEMVALRDLQARLERLTVGQKQPIMAIVDSIKTQGRAPASYSDHIREVRAIALVQALIDSRWSETEACDLVAGELARVGVKGRRGDPITSRAVQTWFAEKIKGNDEAFKSAMSNFAEFPLTSLSRSDLKKFARAFIESGEGIRH